ncbi:hypothetical protein KP509_1Z080900 [Ceratopteris richardii]|nr:hypothetical protein KP509_1Z080900 [Ceratopteris richardii]
MNKDVDRQKSDHEQHAEASTGLRLLHTGDEEKRSEIIPLQLLPVDELVPLSQSLITPALARFFNLNVQHCPSRQQSFGNNAGRKSEQRLQFHYVEQLDQIRHLQEEDGAQNADLSEDFHVNQALDDLFRSQIIASGCGAVKDGDVARLAGTKRLQTDAELLNTFGALHASDGSSTHEHAVEEFGMTQSVLERENSSNSGDGATGSSGCGAGGSSGARTLKRPRLVWTPQLHKRFVDAVSQLGIKNAVPKTIMQLMNVEGLTRENVASHLQKYRLYLRRVQQGNPFSSCSNSSTTKSILTELEHTHHPNALMRVHISTAGTRPDTFFSSALDTRPSNITMTSNGHHSHVNSLNGLSGSVNHLLPQHIPSLLLQPVSHQLSQPMAMVKPPPPFNISQQFEPRLYGVKRVNSPPIRTSASASSDTHLLENMSVMNHAETHITATASSPPRRALTLFPH